MLGSAAALFGNAPAALSAPTPGRDERGVSERSAPSDACVEAASSTPEARAAPQPSQGGIGHPARARTPQQKRCR